MNTTWWWALGAVVVVVALIASLVDGWGRSDRGPRRRPGGGRPRGAGGARPGPGGGRPRGRGDRRPAARPGRRGPGKRPAGRRPRPGEIWWADVPYEDGPGSKDRPCLVLALRGESALVVKITSREREGRAGVIALPDGAVGDAAGRRSYLETEELREVRVGEFRRHVGAVDRKVWARVRHLSR
ncbi:type II toxin-antitoxin system PemK/MazF family toxin [Streptomyces sp. NPDC051776]|uniref:type II toxin-antitoxin system PemK/MazF family toxin n=1 Tax=Streptomyces sp. NPDC051776 TaxID=3155414 RepID=UPI0034476334